MGVPRRSPLLNGFRQGSGKAWLPTPTTPSPLAINEKPKPPKSTSTASYLSIIPGGHTGGSWSIVRYMFGGLHNRGLAETATHGANSSQKLPQRRNVKANSKGPTHIQLYWCKAHQRTTEGNYKTNRAAELNLVDATN